MTDEPEYTPENVGYRRPPRRHQFKPGQSGNPKGRPRRRLPEDASSLFDRPLTVREGDEVRKVHPKELALREQVRRALQDNDLAAQKYLLDQFERHGVLAPRAAERRGGVLVLSDPTMPFHMERILAVRFGTGPWTKEQIAQARADYVASCDEKQAAIDAATGFAALKENANDED